MPAVIPVHVALRSRLKDSVSHALSLNDRLEKVIAVKSRDASGGFHGKIDFSSPPWCAAVANVIMDLHAQSRDTEACLRISLKLPKRPRGGSSSNTRIALENLVKLSEGADDDAVRKNIRWLESWSRRAGIALSETEMPRRLPRIEGRKEPPCPFCKCRTLRMLPLEGIIRCMDKDCKDEEGRRPLAYLKYSRFTKQMELIWQDNIVGIPA